MKQDTLDTEVGRLAEHRTAIIDGVRVHYMIQGEGTKVLLLHGWGGNIRSWEPVTRDLVSKQFQVLAIDFPGFGDSGPPPEPWGVTQYAECLRELLHEAGFAPTHVIAHSFGGRVAIVLASLHPDLVRRLILVASAGIRIVTPRLRIARAIAKATRMTFSVPGLTQFRDSMQARVRRWFASNDYLQAGDLRETFVKVISQDLRDYAKRIKVPTLLIWGDHDTETPLEIARILEQSIPDSGLVLFADAGHYCYLDQFGKFSIIVNEFLKGR